LSETVIRIVALGTRKRSDWQTEPKRTPLESSEAANVLKWSHLSSIFI